jgi:condensin complex subunit 2
MPRVDVTKGRRPRPSTTSEAAFQDASTSNQPEPPINNDKAEKANRRKSAHFGNIGVAPGDEPPEGSTARAGQGKRIVSAVALGAVGKEGRRLGKRLSAVNPEMVGVSWEVRESKYEEWMKAAIDNVSSCCHWSLHQLTFRKSRSQIPGTLP